MKTVSATLQSHIEGELTTLATCWKLTLKNGTEYFFTNHDVDLLIDGDTYEASSGMMPKALDQNTRLAPDNMDVIAFLESAKISEADILAGDLDYATIDIFIVNYNDLKPTGGSIVTGSFGNSVVGALSLSLTNTDMFGHFDHGELDGGRWDSENIPACTVTKVWAYVEGISTFDPSTMKIGIYDASGSVNNNWTLEAQSPGFSISNDDVAKWYSTVCSLSLTAGPKALGVIAYSDDVATGSVYYDSLTGLVDCFRSFITKGTFPSPLGTLTGTLDNFSIYAEYSYTMPLTDKIWLAKGWVLGKIEINDQAFTAEIRGKAQHLDQQLIESTTPECRAVLGDTRCGVDMDDSAGTYRYDTGAVTSQSGDRRTFVDSSAPNSEDFFGGGLLTWSTPGSGDSYNGANAGYQMEVKSYDIATRTFVLFQPMPSDIEIGDEFTVKYGCNKSTTQCKTRFSNLVNFRGEPFIPGWDTALHTGKG